MKNAFSLIELIIVVVIMGVVYTLAVTNFELLKSSTNGVEFKDLKRYLQNIEHEKSVELLCLDGCESCTILVDGKIIANETPFDGMLDSSVSSYMYDFLTGMQEIEQKIYFNDEDVEEDVCFSLSVDNKGVSEQVIVSLKDKVYDFTPYLDSVVVYNELNEVVEAKETLMQEIKQ